MTSQETEHEINQCQLELNDMRGNSSNCEPTKEDEKIGRVQKYKWKSLYRDLEYVQRILDVHSAVHEVTEYSLLKVEHAARNFQQKYDATQLLWKISDFSKHLRRAELGRTPVISSPTFSTHLYGYEMELSLFPCGDGDAFGEYMSLYLCLISGEYDALLPWPFSCPVTLTIPSQCDDPRTSHDHTETFIPHTTEENLPFLGRPEKSFKNKPLGFPFFIALSELATGDYVKDDILFIKVSVDVGDENLH